MSDVPNAREEGFYWVVLGQDPPDMAYWERGEWWLAGDARPWQPDAVDVLSEAGVQTAADAGCWARRLAPVTVPLTIASKDARSRRIGSAPAETAPATRQNRKGRVLAATPTNPPKWKCHERCVADRTGHTAASVGRDAPKDNHHGFTVASLEVTTMSTLLCHTAHNSLPAQPR